MPPTLEPRVAASERELEAHKFQFKALEEANKALVERLTKVEALVLELRDGDARLHQEVALLRQGNEHLRKDAERCCGRTWSAACLVTGALLSGVAAFLGRYLLK